MDGAITAAIILGVTFFAFAKLNSWDKRHRANLTAEQREAEDADVDERGV